MTPNFNGRRFKTLGLFDDFESFRGYTTMIELYNALKFITMEILFKYILRFNLGVAFLKSEIYVTFSLICFKYCLTASLFSHSMQNVSFLTTRLNKAYIYRQWRLSKKTVPRKKDSVSFAYFERHSFFFQNKIVGAFEALIEQYTSMYHTLR